MKVFTIGAYGYTQEEFSSSLIANKIDLFCDVRQRRGVRGPKHNFVNSKALQAQLAKLGIRYVHLKHFAPSDEIRSLQRYTDRESGTLKQNRQQLAAKFVQAYEATYLDDQTVRTLLAGELREAKRVVFFCVEAIPTACHRSLIASSVALQLDEEVVHLCASVSSLLGEPN